MAILKQDNISARNYDAISPSAKSILLLKAITDIPFAKEAAALVQLQVENNPALENKDIAFWKRVVHFENRYWSVDQLIQGLQANNILEISSGFSFRGLEMTKQENIHYIDTDLAELTNQKKDIIAHLQKNTETKGCLETRVLNALDEKEFIETINRFAPGPVIILNEGLLMYLGLEEKKKLCNIIYNILKQRGGYWITGDVYVKSTLERLKGKEDGLKELVEQQRIEENMFESFEAAEMFFEQSGFIVDQEAIPDYSKVSSLKHLLGNATEQDLAVMQSYPKIQASWRLIIKKQD